MTQFGTTFVRLKSFIIILAVFMAFMPAVTASAIEPAMTRNDVYEAQRIMQKFGIPYGPYDGLNGPNTSQGLCIFRQISGMGPSRKNLDAPTLTKLREYNGKYKDFHVAAPTVAGKKTYLQVSQECQALYYVVNGVYWTTFQASTGGAGKETPNSPAGGYRLGDTVRGWTCSTEYPETCRIQTAGQYANYKDANGKVRNKGNMYNKRAFKSGGFYIHGSNNVPPEPGSAGCIRVTVSNADYIAANVPVNTPLFVTGRFNPADTVAAQPSSPATAAAGRTATAGARQNLK